MPGQYAQSTEQKNKIKISTVNLINIFVNYV